ncbi:MAG TPA: FUSC family protein [Acidobacteriaceae bacterium]|jgi:uncharacterized membrane protein YccC|nr:FUSC family protein [Acidobacteriaceae bacterium]
MALKAGRTWSQEVVAVQQRLDSARDKGFLTFEKRALLVLAVKTAAAAGLSYWLATLVGLQDGYWGSISAIIVMQSNVGSTVTASRDRLIGTLIGAGFGGLFSLLSAEFWAYLLAVITAMVTCSLLGLKNSSRLAAVTVTILMLVHRTGSNWTLPLHRVLEVLLGIVVALAISTLVLPSRAKAKLRDGLAQEFLQMGAVFGAIFEGFQGRKPENLDALWKDVEASFAANALLLDAARNEPSSGPASVEALSILMQFGREVEDLLKALELAMAQREADGYAMNLEPELGKLASDIQRGFQQVAASVHHWRFDDASGDDALEDDIAALEAKMASIRPTGLAFPQEEILRAYALKLHMKQLARLLRSARVETGKSSS